VVNGLVLDAQGLAIVEALETQYRVRVPDGRYWYDPLVGRYWLDAQGIAGAEGGPPLVDLVAACRAAARQHGPGGDPWYGSVIGDGNVVGAIFGDTGVTCGADGGCVF
jgi:hypothetical protein